MEIKRGFEIVSSSDTEFLIVRDPEDENFTVMNFEGGIVSSWYQSFDEAVEYALGLKDM
ncbi:MAG: hypothetical protein HQM12_10945 [SAR324 cluster bacterium]|nr:hypothetical protein [SAR324 cluster bacterium]